MVFKDSSGSWQSRTIVRNWLILWDSVMVTFKTVTFKMFWIAFAFFSFALTVLYSEPSRDDQLEGN